MIVTPADSRNLDKVRKLIGKAPQKKIKLEADWGQQSRTSRAAAAAATRGRGGPGRGAPIQP